MPTPSVITCAGDSLTAGVGTGTVSYPSQLATLSGATVNNLGHSGWTSTQIKDDFEDNQSAHFGDAICIWAGTNNFPANTVSAILPDIADIVAAITASPKQYVVIGLAGSSSSIIDSDPTSEYQRVLAVNASLAAAYPDNFIDIRPVLVAAYNPGDSQDVIDHGHDVVPASLRLSGDTVHLNTAGYAIVAQQVKDFFLPAVGVAWHS